MDRMEYTQAVATMRVYEKRLLDPIKVERMVEAESADEVLKILQETEYSRSMGNVKRPEDFETVLSNEMDRVYDDINRKVKDPKIIALLSLRYDYQNLKMLLKAEALGQDQVPVLSELGTVPSQAFKSNFESNNLKDSGQQFAEAAALARDEFSKNRDPQQLDFIVDKTYFSHMNDILKNLRDVDMIKNYIRYQIDSFNLLAFMRTKKQDKDPRFIKEVVVPGGEIPVREVLESATDSPEQIANRFRGKKIGPALSKGIDSFQATGRLGEMERQLENGLIHTIRPAKQVVFGPEPLFGYIAAKERENKNLRMIMVSKLNNISPDRLRERLRDMYV